ncbi:hypothetical protein [Myxococcus sp. RHSTA-1-4]|uniref:hypothetical protein n=1 Tax=Myxococcus sp. RHSTA-1-4 TaxID=2874601 RepID=UPI001CBC5448|nr:hypothetical protein [Myxococcus sp. RHSTA-1-4]MBZ4423267.1 hypothetical protein [Myxococcus sp. RHSTA-1-4]
MTEKTEKTPIQLSSEVARVVDLEAVVLRSSSVQFLGSEAGPPTAPGPMVIQLQHKTSHALNRTAKLLDVTANLILSARDNDESGPERVVIKAEFVVRYSMTEVPDLTDDHYRHFGSLNVMVNVFPYFRELVHTSTSRMGLPPLVLPLFKIAKPASAKAQPKPSSQN